MIKAPSRLSRFINCAEELAANTGLLANRFLTSQINPQSWSPQEKASKNLLDSLFEISEGHTWGGDDTASLQFGEHQYFTLDCIPLHSLISTAMESHLSDGATRAQSMSDLSSACLDPYEQKLGASIESLLRSLDQLIKLRININPKQIKRRFDNQPAADFIQREAQSFEASIKILCEVLGQIFKPLSEQTKDIIEDFIVNSRDALNIRAYYNQKYPLIQDKLRRALGLDTNADGSKRESIQRIPVQVAHKPQPRPILPVNITGIILVKPEHRDRPGTYTFILTDGSHVTHRMHLKPEFKPFVTKHRKPHLN